MMLAGVVHIASVFTAAVLLFFLYDGGEKKFRSSLRIRISAVFMLAAFSFLPPGSLPPFVDMPLGALLFFCFFACSLLLLGDKKLWLPYVFFCATFGVFACFFYYRGVPGSVFNFGTFVAMPFWQFVTPVEGVGGVLLAAIAILFLRPIIRSGKSHGVCGILIGMGASALWVSLFLPFNVAPIFNLSERAFAGIDAVLFWMKIIGVYRLSQAFPSGNP